MATPQPGIGDWYRLNGGALFEVVALDEDDGTIEIQYFDGTVEEMDIEDWESQWDDGALESAQAPEDWTGSVDVEGMLNCSIKRVTVPTEKMVSFTWSRLGSGRVAYRSHRRGCTRLVECTPLG